MRDRFVNNAMLECIARPQYPHSCSVTALVAVVNYLFRAELGLQTPEAVASRLGIAIDAMRDGEGPGNRVIMEWFAAYVDAVGLPGDCAIFADRSTIGDAPASRVAFDELKRIVRSDDRILMYHLPGHYNLVCGYFEHAATPADAFGPVPNPRRWIILADHSSERDPVWSVRWKEIREDLLATAKHCLMIFGKTTLEA